MKITVARTAGFCMGVRRAVDMVLDAANQTAEPVCTYGPLIHNPQVLKMLQDKGIFQLDEIPEKGRGIVLIRAHGVPPSDEEALTSAGFSVVNATCPRVIRVQTIIENHASKGYSTIIVGDKNHPEVIGLSGYTRGMGTTVSSLDQLRDLPVFEKAVVVAQTTQNKAVYEQIKQWCEINAPHYKLFDTICGSTRKRQAETRDLALKHDAVIVVGGKQSGNTRRLAQVAAQTNTPAFHIEDVAELDFSQLEFASSIAITAGASTPNWIILDTLARVKDGLSANHPFVRWMYSLVGFFLKTNLLLAAGAASVTYAFCRVLGISHVLESSLIAMCYILSMQMLNNIFTITSDRYNHPDRASFYSNYKTWLGIFAVMSGLAGIFLAWQQGAICFFMVLVMVFLGAFYHRMNLPRFLKKAEKNSRIRNVPGVKTILIALAWGMVTSVIPALSNQVSVFFAMPCFLYITGLVFARTVFFDVLAVQGDRISGKETLPIFWGEKKTFRVIQNIFLAETALPLLFCVSGVLTWRACLALSVVPFFMFCLIQASVRESFLSGEQCELLMESSFLAMGILMALVY